MDKNRHKIFFFSGTHWDREWYQSFQEFRYELVKVLDEVIEVLEKNSDIKVFHMDGQTIVLEDYMEIRPENKERLSALIRDGRIAIGPWYVMPDEFLLSGESHIRNLTMGHKICENWGSKAWKFGYICDIFGHMAQMPQIFNGFGIKNAVLARGTNEHNFPAFFRWTSPNGSECITFKLEDKDGYGAFCVKVIGWKGAGNNKPKSEEQLIRDIRAYIDYEIGRTEVPVAIIMDGMDHERIHPETGNYLNIIRKEYPESEVYHVNLEELTPILESYKDKMPVKTGELIEPARKNGPFLRLLPNVFSSWYPVKMYNDQCQTLLEKMVLPLEVISSFMGYGSQKQYVDLAYKYLIQNQGHDSICGCSIDQVHTDMVYRFDQSRIISKMLINKFLYNGLPLEIQSETENCKVLRLWNTLPYRRKEVISVDIDFDSRYSSKYFETIIARESFLNSFMILNSNNEEVPYGLVDIKKDCTLRRGSQATYKADVYTVSVEVDVPAMGMAEYSIVPYDKVSRYTEFMSYLPDEAENEHIKLKINPNGTMDITDKKTGVRYPDLMSFIDDGDTGDGYYHLSPISNRAVSSNGTKCIIERVENNSVRCTFKVTTFMNIPESMINAERGFYRSDKYVEMKIISNISLMRTSRFVEVDMTIDNNAKDHRLRMILPTNTNSATYFSSQPFAFVERKAGIDHNTRNWKENEVYEKPMSGIVGRKGADGCGLAFVSAYGLHECAAYDDSESTLAITLFRAFSSTFMTNGEVACQINRELKYKFRITPVDEGINYSALTRLQECMQSKLLDSTLNIQKQDFVNHQESYFELSGENINLSILKLPEEGGGNEVVARIYNLSGEISRATLKFSKNIASVSEVNMLEEYLKNLDFDGNSFEDDLRGWEIKTYRIAFSL